MTADVESVDETRRARAVGSRRGCAGHGAEGASAGTGEDAISPGRMDFALRELKVAVEQANLRLRRMGKNVFLEIVETSGRPGIRIRDPDRRLAARGILELVGRVSPADAMKWLERLQGGKGLVVDEEA